MDVVGDVTFVMVAGGGGSPRLEHKDRPAGRRRLVCGASRHHIHVAGPQRHRRLAAVVVAKSDLEFAVDHEEELVSVLMDVPDVLAKRVSDPDVVVVDPGHDPGAIRLWNVANAAVRLMGSSIVLQSWGSADHV